MDENRFIAGARVNSQLTPITYAAWKQHSDALEVLNSRPEITFADFAQFVDQSFAHLFKALGDLELSTRFNVTDETKP